MNSTLLVVAIVVAVVLAAVIAVQRVKYKNLVQQTQKSMDDLQAKEAIMQKEAMIKAKEALHNEREQLNEDEKTVYRELAEGISNYSEEIKITLKAPVITTAKATTMGGKLDWDTVENAADKIMAIIRTLIYLIPKAEML